MKRNTERKLKCEVDASVFEQLCVCVCALDTKEGKKRVSAYVAW